VSYSYEYNPKLTKVQWSISNKTLHSNTLYLQWKPGSKAVYLLWTIFRICLDSGINSAIVIHIIGCRNNFRRSANLKKTWSSYRPYSYIVCHLILDRKSIFVSTFTSDIWRVQGLMSFKVSIHTVVYIWIE